MDRREISGTLRLLEFQVAIVKEASRLIPPNRRFSANVVIQVGAVMLDPRNRELMLEEGQVNPVPQHDMDEFISDLLIALVKLPDTPDGMAGKAALRNLLDLITTRRKISLALITKLFDRLLPRVSILTIYCRTLLKNLVINRVITEEDAKDMMGRIESNSYYYQVSEISLYFQDRLRFTLEGVTTSPAPIVENSGPQVNIKNVRKPFESVSTVRITAREGLDPPAVEQEDTDSLEEDCDGEEDSDGEEDIDNDKVNKEFEQLLRVVRNHNDRAKITELANAFNRMMALGAFDRVTLSRAMEELKHRSVPSDTEGIILTVPLPVLLDVCERILGIRIRGTDENTKAKKPDEYCST